MPPRRRPRSWLAGRLRSAAGAVQRLAGRIEPDGHLPPLSQPPVATPRRFGEPPRHWLDLVAAHAPGLLHDLDLDPSPADAEAGDGQPGGSTGRVDTDAAGPGTFGRSPGSGRAGGSGRRDGEVDTGGPVSAAGTGRRGRGPRGDTGPTRSPAEHRSGRPVRWSARGDQPDGTRAGAAGTWAGAAGRSGGGASPSRSDTTSPPTGATWPDVWAEPTGPHVWAEPTGPDVWAEPTGPHVWAEPTGPDRSAEPTGPVGPGAAVPPVRPANQGSSTAVDATALDASGLPRSIPQPIRSMVFRAQRPPGSRPHRPEPEPTRTTARRLTPWPAAVDHGPGRSAGSPAAPPTADRRTGGRDGYPGDPAGPPRPGTDRRGRRAGAPGAAGSARVGPATWSGRPAWPDLGGADASGTGRTAPDGRHAPTTGRGDVTRVGDGDRWLDLPGERARSGRPAALPDPGWDTVGGGRATGTAAPPPVGSARGDDPWPALPDDGALWSVAGPALDTAQLTRLDREQAGD
ncbi:hypothetical protein [Micromonospora parva]|uniref:hypothetical protein n=1 Tax=Micromonospora parva TaxID=1464048 RepID=UPI00364B2B3D